MCTMVVLDVVRGHPKLLQEKSRIKCTGRRTEIEQYRRGETTEGLNTQEKTR